MHRLLKISFVRSSQRGGTVLGLVIGLLVGIVGVAGLVFWYGKTQNPVVNKLQQKETLSEADEAAKNKAWNPNIALFDKPVPPSLQARSASDVASSTNGAANSDGQVVADKKDAANPAKPSTELFPPKAPDAASAAKSAPAKLPTNDPIADLINAKGKVAQANAAGGGVTKPPDANQEEVMGVYYVQVGAFKSLDDANAQKAKLAMLGVETKITEREQSGKPVYRVRAGGIKKLEEADSLRLKLEKAGFEAGLIKSPK